MDEGDDDYFQSASHAEQMMLKMDAYFDKQQVLISDDSCSWQSFVCLSLMLIYGRPASQDADTYIIVLFLLSSFFPCLISAVADWMSTILPHIVWP